ncbi:MAG: type II toxin-antitoxin system MqsA family antitoxin [Acidimicrobiales bacterium]
MKCLICRQGDIRPGPATVTLNRDHTTLVVKAVPATVCDNCGEEYLDEEVTVALLDLVDTAARSGVEVEVRDYASASPARP